MSEAEAGRSRAVRTAINENTFREINEQLVAAVALDDPVDDLHDVVCECARVDCTELITLAIKEYEAVRQAGDRFVVAPGPKHVTLEHERVAERKERYWVVAKIGTAGTVAEQLDPRD